MMGDHLYDSSLRGGSQYLPLDYGPDSVGFSYGDGFPEKKAYSKETGLSAVFSKDTIELIPTPQQQAEETKKTSFISNFIGWVSSYFTTTSKTSSTSSINSVGGTSSLRTVKNDEDVDLKQMNKLVEQIKVVNDHRTKSQEAEQENQRDYYKEFVLMYLALATLKKEMAGDVMQELTVKQKKNLENKKNLVKLLDDKLKSSENLGFIAKIQTGTKALSLSLFALSFVPGIGGGATAGMQLLTGASQITSEIGKTWHKNKFDNLQKKSILKEADIEKNHAQITKLTKELDGTFKSANHIEKQTADLLRRHHQAVKTVIQQ